MVNIVSTAPMEVVCIDYLSLERSKGVYENILVITDYYTRYAQAIPTRNQTAQTTAKALFENFFLHYGFLARIHSDQGANFESKLIQCLCSLTGMRKTRTTPYHPMGNGMAERFNKTLLNMLGTLKESQKSDWKSHVPTMTHAYKAASHDSTGFSPFFLMFGRHPPLAVDAFLGLPQDTETVKGHKDYVDRLKQRLAPAYESAGRQTDYYDEKVRYSNHEVGDCVLVEKKGHKGMHKLADLWEHCPYVVIGQPVLDIPVYEVVKENTYKPKPRTLHRNMLLPFTGLPYPRTHSPTKARKDQQHSKEREELETAETQEIDTSEESERDSRESSADEEEREAETTAAAPYIPPILRGSRQKLPQAKPSGIPPQPGIRRGDRDRKKPRWLNDDVWIRSQHSSTSTSQWVTH